MLKTGLLLATIIFCIFIFLYIRFIKGKKSSDYYWTNFPQININNLGEIDSLEILPLIDWSVAKKGLIGEAGVSYLIKTPDTTILFDVGYNFKHSASSPLLKNMDALGVNLEDIDCIAISHNHPDHVGGMKWKARKTFSLSPTQINLPGKKVYTPIKMEYPGLIPIHSEQPTVISPGISTIGVIQNQCFFFGNISEQAIALNIKDKGIVLIVGCGHQTVERIIERTKKIFGKKIFAVVGGLHFPVSDSRIKILGIPIQKYLGTCKVPWNSISLEEAKDNINLLKREEVQKIALSLHDSCDLAADKFSEVFKENFQVIKVGEKINF